MYLVLNPLKAGPMRARKKIRPHHLQNLQIVSRDPRSSPSSSAASAKLSIVSRLNHQYSATTPPATEQARAPTYKYTLSVVKARNPPVGLKCPQETPLSYHQPPHSAMYQPNRMGRPKNQRATTPIRPLVRTSNLAAETPCQPTALIATPPRCLTFPGALLTPASLT